uniref:Amidase domain-containing protein n=1 Tax=Romanomermis culicivorax TaxID=13658 RepID=A0A915HSS5_ROMCU
MFEDADVVALIKKAGAIIVCTTNTSEMCMWYESSNTIYGRTSNPYDSRCTSGGSSGGQGALVGAAAFPFAVGSDLAGSIRIPAYFNGIFGHKTSRNIISQKGIHPQAKGPQMDLYAMGPMCRYAEDLVPMLKVLAGPNLHLLSLDAKDDGLENMILKEYLFVHVDLRNLRIFYMTEIDTITSPRVDHELKECIHEITKYFRTEYDIMCYKLDLEYMHWALSIWLDDMDAPGSPSFGQEICNLEGEVNPVLELFKWSFGQSNHTYPALTLALVEKFLHRMGTDHERQYVKSMGQTLYRQLEDLLSNLAPPINKKLTDSEADNVVDILSSDDFHWSDRFSNNRRRCEAVFLFPPHPVLPPYHNQSCLTPFTFQYTAIFNSLGLPVTCCP